MSTMGDGGYSGGGMDPGQAPGDAAPVRVTFVSSSDTGRVREANEDSFVLVEPTDPQMSQRRGMLAAVADGMGGAAGGSLASRLVVEAVRDTYYEDANSSPTDALRAAVQAANATVLKRAMDQPQFRGMGSTCTAVAVVEGRLHLAHVGDSRAYLLRQNRILQLTEDHSKVAALLREGKITAEQAAQHPERNVLNRSLGMAPEVEVDILPQPLPLADGDRLLLCSDGLINHVSDVEILQVTEEASPQQALDSLVQLANDRGGTDNITVQIGAVSMGLAAVAAEPPAAESAWSFEDAVAAAGDVPGDAIEVQDEFLDIPAAPGVADEPGFELDLPPTPEADVGAMAPAEKRGGGGKKALIAGAVCVVLLGLGVLGLVVVLRLTGVLSPSIDGLSSAPVLPTEIDDPTDEPPEKTTDKAKKRDQDRKSRRSSRRGGEATTPAAGETPVTPGPTDGTAVAPDPGSETDPTALAGTGDDDTDALAMTEPVTPPAPAEGDSDIGAWLEGLDGGDTPADSSGASDTGASSTGTADPSPPPDPGPSSSSGSSAAPRSGCAESDVSGDYSLIKNCYGDTKAGLASYYTTCSDLEGEMAALSLRELEDLCARLEGSPCEVMISGMDPARYLRKKNKHTITLMR